MDGEAFQAIRPAPWFRKTRPRLFLGSFVRRHAKSVRAWRTTPWMEKALLSIARLASTYWGDAQFGQFLRNHRTRNGK
jgi:hypothetical protein